MTLENERIRLGVGGPEMIRLAEDIGTLAVRVAEAKGGERLKAETEHYLKGQISRMRVTCGSCATRMVKDAAADALRAEPIERPAWDRRTDFLLRLVMAFYPHGLVTERKEGSPSFPRHCLGRMAVFLREVLGTLPYSDLNADASRLLSRFPNVQDGELRRALLGHPPSRLLLLKTLIRLVSAFEHTEDVRAIFMETVRSEAWPNVFRPTPQHFVALCDGLFGELMVMLQNPKEGDDLDQWFGRGATERLLDMLERVAVPA